jgi:WD40 repeat protein
LGHTNWINAFSFSPNGQILASGSYDNTIRLWNAKTGAAVGKPLNCKTYIDCLSFSPDGQILASGGGDNVIHLWDSGTGITVGEQLEEHTRSIISLSLSPDGRKVASGSYDLTIRMWDAETGSTIGTPIQCKHFPYRVHLRLLDSELLLLVDNLAYNLSSDPPVLCSPINLPEPEPATSPIRYHPPWTYVRATTITRFCLPSIFSIRKVSIQEGKIAYGALDGTVIIVDCTHLL